MTELQVCMEFMYGSSHEQVACKIEATGGVYYWKVVLKITSLYSEGYLNITSGEKCLYVGNVMYIISHICT